MGAYLKDRTKMSPPGMHYFVRSGLRSCKKAKYNAKQMCNINRKIKAGPLKCSKILTTHFERFRWILVPYFI